MRAPRRTPTRPRPRRLARRTAPTRLARTALRRGIRPLPRCWLGATRARRTGQGLRGARSRRGRNRGLWCPSARAPRKTRVRSARRVAPVLGPRPRGPGRVPPPSRSTPPVSSCAARSASLRCPRAPSRLVTTKQPARQIPRRHDAGRRPEAQDTVGQDGRRLIPGAFLLGRLSTGVPPAFLAVPSLAARGRFFLRLGHGEPVPSLYDVAVQGGYAPSYLVGAFRQLLQACHHGPGVLRVHPRIALVHTLAAFVAYLDRVELGKDWLAEP